ncbi:MAG: sigma-70 family RNA polymerase sigma factor [Lachnospiraceae bacterium]|nr:sigma-70 family RNA polymerase sigma factor [Lachnospiraceae bacterium]
MESLFENAYNELVKLYNKNSYLCFDNLVDILTQNSLSISEVDALSDRLLKNGIMILDEVPEKNYIENESEELEESDYSQVNYNEIYDRCIQLAPQLEGFIQQIRKIRPPQFREVSALKYQVVEGNSVARKRMIEMYIRRAIGIALQRAEKYDLDLEETIGNALEGLVMGVDKYNPDLHGAFNSYISNWIFQNVSREQVFQNYLVYCPVHVKDRIISAYTTLNNEGCIDCDNLYKCNKVRKTINHILDSENNIYGEEIIRAIQYPMSLEYLEEIVEEEKDIESEEEKRYIQAVTTDSFEEDYIKEIYQKEVVQSLLKLCNDNQRFVIEERYGLLSNEPKTLEEVGLMMGVTRERVRQIESKALRRFENKLRLESRQELVHELLARGEKNWKRARF